MSTKTPVVLSALVVVLGVPVTPLQGQFVYVANANSNNLSGFTINAATGALTSIAGSPFAAGSNPATVAADLGGKFAYVANSNADLNQVSGFAINATTGALTVIPGSPFHAAGQSPFSVVVHPTGNFAYVSNLYGGSISGYTINAASGALTDIPGTPFAVPGAPQSLALDPAGKFLYVADINTNDVSAYTISAATGALSPVSGSPFAAGVNPASVTVDPTGKFVYVANLGGASISAYSINAATGALSAISGSPFSAGSGPFGVVVDPTGKFVYVANSVSNDVSGYTINATTGGLTTISGSPFAAGCGPASVAVDRTGNFVYVPNSGHWYNANCGAIGQDVSGYTINPTTGALSAIAGSPFFVGVGFAPVFAVVAAAAPAAADLSVTNIDSPDPVIRGNNITYTVTVTNNSQAAADNVSLTDPVPADTNFVSNSGAAGWICTNPRTNGNSGGSINCTRPSLPSGASSTFTMVFAVKSGTKENAIITNTATIASSTSDPNSGNNSATATTTVIRKP